jgi:hypothetical protein
MIGMMSIEGKQLTSSYHHLTITNIIVCYRIVGELVQASRVATPDPASRDATETSPTASTSQTSTNDLPAEQTA